jgi:hypothetical protein
MMRIVFIADEFRLRTPVQQLLDRFLIGYPNGGTFHRPDCDITLVTPQRNADIERRMRDFGLRWQTEPADADGAMIFTGRSGDRRYKRCFVYGGTSGVVGTAVRGAWLLPEIAVANPSKALAIVQGEYPDAEREGVDALLMVIGRSGLTIGSAARLDEKDFWPLLKRDFWPLMKSAISRSDSPRANAVQDGRTEDVVGLGLLEELVKEPRGLLIKVGDIQCAIAVMNGALGDYNVALQSRSGGIVSAQLHRPPPPGEHHYSRLAAMLEKYFRTGVPPWPPEQNAFTAQLFKRLAKLDTRPSRILGQSFSRGHNKGTDSF